MTMTMDAVYDAAPQSAADRILLVMLPCAKGSPQDMVDYGFVQALRERSLPIDVVAVDTHLGYYLERSLIRQLTHDIIAPARARGYRRIWLMGISLGGMGALMYASEYPADIEGVILLAPYLGVSGTIAEVVGAGGLARWQSGVIKEDDDERRLLAWIKTCPFAMEASPKIYLGCGAEDRFVVTSQLLAERLPAARKISIPGGHDWATWAGLWRHLLDQNMFFDAATSSHDEAVTALGMTALSA